MQDFNSDSVRSDCEIRPPQPGDYVQMADLAGQLGYESSTAEIQVRLMEMHDSDQYAVYVADLRNGKIGGWVCAYIFRSVETASFAEISGLVVDQRVRSRGIGAMLVNAAEAWAKSVGADVISVRSNVIRDRAHRFYERHGYELVKTQKAFRTCLLNL